MELAVMPLVDQKTGIDVCNVHEWIYVIQNLSKTRNSTTTSSSISEKKSDCMQGMSPSIAKQPLALHDIVNDKSELSRTS